MEDVIERGIQDRINTCHQLMEEKSMVVVVDKKRYKILAGDKEFDSMFKSYLHLHNEMIAARDWAEKESLLERCFKDICFLIEVFCLNKQPSDQSIDMSIRLFNILVNHLMYEHRYPVRLTREGNIERVQHINIDGEDEFLDAWKDLLLHFDSLVKENCQLQQLLFDFVFSAFGRYLTYSFKIIEFNNFQLLLRFIPISRQAARQEGYLLKLLELCRVVSIMPVVMEESPDVEERDPGCCVREIQTVRRDIVLSLLEICADECNQEKSYTLEYLHEVTSVLYTLESKISSETFPRDENGKIDAGLNENVLKLKTFFLIKQKEKAEVEWEVSDTGQSKKKKGKKNSNYQLIHYCIYVDND